MSSTSEIVYSTMAFIVQAGVRYDSTITPLRMCVMCVLL